MDSRSTEGVLDLIEASDFIKILWITGQTRSFPNELCNPRTTGNVCDTHWVYEESKPQWGQNLLWHNVPALLWASADP